MHSSRRDFLKLTGIALIGAAVPDALLPAALAPAWAGAPVYRSDARALKAARWGMAVDLAKCRPDCTDCVAACHAAHNVPAFDQPKDEIAWIRRETFGRIFPAQVHVHLEPRRLAGPVIALCNHCANPPCVRVCPTGATFRRPDGIVMMDYHRCIGCRFCIAACPYGARSMNYRDPRPFIRRIDPGFPTRTKGVVEKCNFCVERLAVGKPPACVAACPEKALAFGDLEAPDSAVRRAIAGRTVLRRKPELGTEPQVYYTL